MKKFFFLICMLCFNVLVSAQMNHFNVEVNDSILDVNVVSYFAELFDLPESTSFVFVKSSTDNNNIVHARYDQYIDDIVIEGCQILVHSHNGYVQSINGVIVESKRQQFLTQNRLVKKIKQRDHEKTIVLRPINGENEVRYAYKYTSEELGAYVYVDVENGDTIDVVSLINDAQTKYTTNTIYYGRQQLSVNSNGKQRQFSVADPSLGTILATELDFSNPSGSYVYEQMQANNTYCEEEKDSVNSYIASITFQLKNIDWSYDTEEGTETYTMPDLYITITNNSGVNVYTSQVINNWNYVQITFTPMFRLDGEKYTIRLYDDDVFSDDYAGGFTISSTTKGIGTLSTSNFDVTINVTGNPVRDAHWSMEKTLHYYENVFGLKSYDGNGSTVYQFVSPVDTAAMPNNAYARNDYPYCVVYGLGDGIKNSPFVSLDIVAHEFTHMVTFHKTISGLEYKGESGALNEGFSDIFAVLVEGYTFGKYDWCIGENVELKHEYTRSLKIPTTGADPQPTTYGKGYWLDPNGNLDKGGVHRNSSILSHMFYLLSEGGSGKNDNEQSYDVKGIGVTKATEITYNTWMNRLSGRSTFADARESFIAEVIANPKYGKDSQEYQSVLNAWHAVGVGEKYVAPKEEFQLKPGKYVIVANRVEDDKNNWFYMTSDLGTASTKRFQAVSTNVENIDAIVTTDLEDKYIWELEADGSNWKLKNGEQYVTWKSGNSANLDATGKSLTFDVADNQVIAHFYDGSAERYLSLHVGNDYFAFYANTGQIEQLYFLPCEEGQQPPVEEPADEFIVLAQRNENSNWFYMTADLGTAGTKRFQAIDAGTPNKALINTSPTDTKYIWSFEEVDGGVALVNGEQYASWKSGNSAILSTTPMALNIIDVSEDQVNMSFVDGEGYTRYLSLNATAGNNYFAFYKGTTQKCNLLIIPYGEKITTDIDVILSETPIIHKVIRDGQLLIIRDGKTYNAQGILISY